MASSGICMVCGSMGMGAGGDGFFYCIICGSQSQTLQEQDLDDFEDAKVLHVREANVSRKLEQDAAIVAFQQQGAVAGGHGDPLLASAFTSQAEQETLLRIMSQNSTHVASAEEELRNRMAVASQYGGTAGMQFWSLSQTDEPAVVLQRLGNRFREAYVRGVQRILQMQCEALVEQFGVSPLICGIAGPIWLKFLASTHVFEKEWADEAIQLAEAKKNTKKDEHCGDTDPGVVAFGCSVASFHYRCKAVIHQSIRASVCIWKADLHTGCLYVSSCCVSRCRFLAERTCSLQAAVLACSG